MKLQHILAATWHGVVMLSVVSLCFGCQNTRKDPFPNPVTFADPDPAYKAFAGREFDLRTLDEKAALAIIRDSKEKGYGGVFIVSNYANAGDLDQTYVKQSEPHLKLGDKGLVYLSPEFLAIYKATVEEAARLNMQVILYDDYAFPTGTVAGQFYRQFPSLMASRLDKVEANSTSACSLALSFPEGTILGAALMNMADRSVTDVSDQVKDRAIRIMVGAGTWKLMGFYLNHEAVLKIRNPGIMNYLEKDAVAKFLSISYDKFYQTVGNYFGTVIPMSFYDEPSLHWLDGRIWSAELNRIFREKYGESPIKYYPALWYDMGDKTASARNALLGIRADMYADAFIRQLHEWCAAHHFKLGGHLDQEEIPNPSMSNGDLMKMFQYQDVPGADDIFWWGRSNPGYKVVTSAAYNYDKPVTWSETYAAYGSINRDTAYRVAMDQYAMGINMQTPFPQDIEKKMSLAEIQEFNRYIGRLSYLLQGGKHISDVAVLYPIASAMAYNVFADGWEYAYLGGNMPTVFDYMTVGEYLFRYLRMDFTYLHPEVLDGKCDLEKDEIHLMNPVNDEKYKLFILPGGSTIKASNAEKLLAYFNQGGKIIATGMLPVFSAEFGKDEVVRNAMMKIFGTDEKALLENRYEGIGEALIHSNQAGGKAYFLPKLTPELLKETVDQCLPVKDVSFPDLALGKPYEQEGTVINKYGEVNFILFNNESVRNYCGALTYTHKVKHGHDIYFFSNSTAEKVTTRIRLRGKRNLVLWNPATGQHQATEGVHTRSEGVECTEFRLELAGQQALFFVTK